MTEANSSEYHRSFTGKLVDLDGNERHFINGAYGRHGDLPSVIWADGSLFWHKENPKRGGMCQAAAVLHRDGDLPAVIKANGDEFYYQNGKLNRDGDLPAVKLADGTLKWFVGGNFVRCEIPSPQPR